MTPYLLAYLSIGALTFVAKFVLSVSTRRDIIRFITENSPTTEDSTIGIGLDIIFHILLVLVGALCGIVVWPLVWAALGIGTWRLRKE